MAIVHVRNLAKYGVITDLDPNDLPPEAWSFGLNVRFRNGKVTGAPIFRNVKASEEDDPRFVLGVQPASGLDYVFTGYKSGNVYLYNNGSETLYSPAGYSPSVSEGLWTYTTLADVVYVNREDRPPWYVLASGSSFEVLDNWDATWTARLLRSCGGALVALNVTKGSTHYPTMVKTSSIPLSGAVPSSWDQTDPATLASENILAEMKGPITDANNLGSALCIYGYEETWMMRANGSIEVYEYVKLPFNKGSIGPNCSQEVDGMQFVFGPDDIWRHDGVTAESICTGKVRDFIYNGINKQKFSRCFVAINEQLKELYFCYVSGDRGVYFLEGSSGCNRQAVYNYETKSWSFDDTPLVFSSTRANISVSITYSSVVGTYSSFGGSYQDFEDGYKRTQLYVGAVNSTYSLTASLYAFDLYGDGSTSAFNVDVNATAPRYLEKDGIDLDELGADLRGYKYVQSLYPQGRLGISSAPIMIAYGASDYFGQSPTFGPYQPFDAGELYKLDYRASGRYLSLRVKHEDYKEMTLTGFDVDLKALGNR